MGEINEDCIRSLLKVSVPINFFVGFFYGFAYFVCLCNGFALGFWPTLHAMSVILVIGCIASVVTAEKHADRNIKCYLAIRCTVCLVILVLAIINFVRLLDIAGGSLTW